MDILKCYKIIDADPDCTWEELRLAYRRQVQKYHPDRYQQFPDKKLIAEERMLEVNKAFDTLAKYYKENGYLPGIKLGKSSTTLGRKSYSKASNHTTSEKRSNTPHTIKPSILKQSALRTSWLIVITVVVLGYYFILGDENSSQPDNPNNEAFRSTPKSPIPKETNKEQINHPSPESKIQDDTFFTYGDTPGKVFEVQGVPTRTVGNIWFYGRSEVHFNKGEVVSWYSAPSDPLKTE